MNKALLAQVFITILILICASLWFPEGASGQTIDTLLRSAKIHHPETVLKDFKSGKPTTRVIVNLSKPLIFQQITNLKDMEFRKQLRETVRSVRNRVINRVDPGKLRITNRFVYMPGFSAALTMEGLKELTQIEEVVSIEKDEILQAHLAQGIPLMNASTVRSSYSGAGMAIAICDTGIDYAHPMLGGEGFPNSKVIGGYDTGDDDNDPMDKNGHGTCCAGIAAGDIGTTGDYVGGVAHNAKLYALKISFGDGASAYTSDMIEAWEWCITHQNDDPSNPIMIISASFGGGRYTTACDSASTAMTEAAANAVAAGITLFASSGNDGYCDSIAWPACISHVISVGAVYDASFGTYLPCVSSESCATKYETGSCETGYYVVDSAAADVVPSYSNVATFMDLLAPSHRVYTTDIAGFDGYAHGDYYSSFGGTSASCPYAAGAAACLQSAAQSVSGSFLTPAQVKSKLTSTGDLITDTKVSITKPRVNLDAAVNTSPELVIGKVTLKDLDSDSLTKEFSPGTNVRYKVQFTVHVGDPDKLYKVVVKGKAFSLHKPDGINPEWTDKFSDPARKVRKLHVDESRIVSWDRQIPIEATPGTKARVRFTLKLMEYDEPAGTWNLLGIYYGKRMFNIID